jgi:hypothetical protein
VAEFTAAELGCLLQTTTGAAASLLRDALNLRHRHPRLWAAVMQGEVEDWLARKVARAAAHLTQEEAAQVDVETLEALTGVPYARAMDVVGAAIIRADPGEHEQRRAEAARQRYVSRSRRDNPYGLRTLIAQTTAGDVARIEAMVDHLAVLLLAAGDADPRQVRRAKALGLLANPALACVFLARTVDARRARQAARAAEDHACAGTASCDCRDPHGSGASRQPLEPDLAPDSGVEIDPAPPTAAQTAAELGRLLDARGPDVLDGLRARTVLYVHLAEEALRDSAGRPPATVRQETAPSGASPPDATLADTRPPDDTVCGVARVEGLGPVSIPQLREWVTDRLGADHVVVRPVLDLAGQTPVDAYEAPPRMRESLHHLHPHEVWPWGTAPSRQTDTDHTRPYRPPGTGGPPGQTRLDNLGPLARGHHRARPSGGSPVTSPCRASTSGARPPGTGTASTTRAATHSAGRLRRSLSTTGSGTGREPSTPSPRCSWTRHDARGPARPRRPGRRRPGHRRRPGLPGHGRRR